tara:strand:+ start:5620 stop:6591 length:972 start_codon:yes stop_codon:yes gene_type:complete
MSKPIAIIAGEPNSISSEIIFKTWKFRKKYKHNSFFIIGSKDLLNLQKKKLKFNIQIKEIKNKFSLKDINTNKLPVFNINFTQKKAFQKISSISNKYIFECFDAALKMINQKKIMGFINCPISKEHLLKKKYNGITEFLAQKSGMKGNEVMLIYNKKLSVSPITTHLPLSYVSKKINKSKIVKNVKIINKFYTKILKKKPKFAILGLNPHNFSTKKASEEKKIIYPAIKKLKNDGIKVVGPVSPDTSFMFFGKENVNVIIGMYHDQVLTPFKTLFKYDAINLTLGLSYIRISPDHGTASNILGKKIADPKSLIESVKFFNFIK